MEMQILTQEQAQKALLPMLQIEKSATTLLTASSLYCSEQNLSNELDCFHSKSKTFAYLENNWPKSGLAVLVVMVGELANAFNIGKNMSAAQVTDCALMILNDYPQLKIDDVALCFTKAKKGEYGQIYDRLDSAVVFGWLNRFMADKDEQIEYYWQHQQRVIKPIEQQPLLIAGPEIKELKNEEVLNHIRSIKKKVIEIQIKNNTAKRFSSTPPEINPMQWVHNLWISKFKKMNEDQFWADKIPMGSRFILYRGKHIDLIEFIEYKNRQLLRYAAKINKRWNIQ